MQVVPDLLGLFAGDPADPRTARRREGWEQPGYAFRRTLRERANAVWDLSRTL
jgi:hypothetical protein